MATETKVKAAVETDNGYEVQLVEISKIEAPKGGKDLRTFSKEFAAKLAKSIKEEGLHQAIVVRPNPEKPGFYLVVMGRHRLAAMKMLKEQFIAAKVVDLDDTSAEFASISENLWRNPLTKNQQVISIKRWWDHFLKLHPEAGDKAATARAAKDAKSDPAAAEATPPAADGTAVPADCTANVAEQTTEAPATSAAFIAQVAAATGQSERSVQREHRIAKAFTEDQLEVLNQMTVNGTDREMLSKIKDIEKRGAVVNLIASGQEVADAVKTVCGEAAPTRAGETKEKAAEKAEVKEMTRDEMSDDDWFNTYCGEKAKIMADSTKYKIDAIWFRWILEARTTFRTKIKAKAKLVKQAKIFGPFFNITNRLISVSHPKDWPLCGKCGGRGLFESEKCSKCYGACYELKVEEY